MNYKIIASRQIELPSQLEVAFSKVLPGKTLNIFGRTLIFSNNNKISGRKAAQQAAQEYDVPTKEKVKIKIFKAFKWVAIGTFSSEIILLMMFAFFSLAESMNEEVPASPWIEVTPEQKAGLKKEKIALDTPAIRAISAFKNKNITYENGIFKINKNVEDKTWEEFKASLPAEQAKKSLLDKLYQQLRAEQAKIAAAEAAGRELRLPEEINEDMVKTYAIDLQAGKKVDGRGYTVLERHIPGSGNQFKHPAIDSSRFFLLLYNHKLNDLEVLYLGDTKPIKIASKCIFAGDVCFDKDQFVDIWVGRVPKKALAPYEAKYALQFKKLFNELDENNYVFKPEFIRAIDVMKVMPPETDQALIALILNAVEKKDHPIKVFVKKGDRILTEIIAGEPYKRILIIDDSSGNLIKIDPVNKVYTWNYLKRGSENVWNRYLFRWLGLVFEKLKGPTGLHVRGVSWIYDGQTETVGKIYQGNGNFSDTSKDQF